MNIHETDAFFKPLDGKTYSDPLTVSVDTYESVLTEYRLHIRHRYRRALYRRLKQRMQPWKAFLLTRIVCYHVNRGCFATNETLAEVINKSVRHIRRALKEWEDRGWITRKDDDQGRVANRLIVVNAVAVLDYALEDNPEELALAELKALDARFASVTHKQEAYEEEVEAIRRQVEAERVSGVCPPTLTCDDEVDDQNCPGDVLEMSDQCPPPEVEKPALTCENSAKNLPITRDVKDFKELEDGQNEGSEASPPPWISLREAVQIWNAICAPTLPEVKKLTDSRARKWKARQKEIEEYRTSEGFKAVCERVIRSSFLRGERNGTEHERWRATFDFLLQASSAVKVIEGAYDDRRPKESAEVWTVVASPEPYKGLTEEEKRRRSDEIEDLRKALRLRRRHG